MLDMLSLRCWFQDPDRFDLEKLRLPLQGSIDPEGEVYALRHPWESVPSSFSDMAFKVFDFNPDRPNPDPFIEIKASPAKLVQGHNVYGSDDLGECALVLMELLVEAYPFVVDLLDWSTWELAQVDITYASWAESERHARQFINALCNVSNGQTKARTGYDGTAYFGKKNSRLKKIKVYDKLAEIFNYLKLRKGSRNDPAKYYPPYLLAWCKGMIRWEVSLKTRWFERRNIPTKLLDLKKVFDPKAYWEEATKELFEALEGETMQTADDDQVLNALREKYPTVNSKTGNISYGSANAAFRTYLSIKSEGFVKVKELSSSTTFYRHIEMLTSCGLSKAILQNMQGEGFNSKVVPMIRYAVVEFRNQFPEWLNKAA